MSVRWTSLFVLLAIAIVAKVPPVSAQSKSTDQGRSQSEVYQRAIELYQQKRYQDSIKPFELAYAQNPLPGILLNIANAYRHLAQEAPRSPEFIDQALAHFDRYLTEEHGVTRCEVMRQRAEVERLKSQQRYEMSAAKLAVESVTVMGTFYEQNHSPGILRCIAAAHLGYAKELPPSQPRVEQARLAVAAFRTYFQAAAQQKKLTDPLAFSEREEAQALVDALAPKSPAGETATAELPVHRRTWFRGIMGTLGGLAVAGVVVGAVLGTRPHSPDLPAGAIEIPSATPWMTTSLK